MHEGHTYLSLASRHLRASRSHTGSYHSSMRRDHAQVPVVLLDNSHRLTLLHVYRCTTARAGTMHMPHLSSVTRACLTLPHCFIPTGAQQHAPRPCTRPIYRARHAPHIPTLLHTHRCTAAYTETCVPICLARSWGTLTSPSRLRCWDTGAGRQGTHEGGVEGGRQGMKG